MTARASHLAPLVADLESIAAAQPAAWPMVGQLRQSRPDFAACAPLVVAAAAAARLSVFQTTALMLKLLAAEHAARQATLVAAPGRLSWQPLLERVHVALGAVGATLAPAEFELLMVEQHALGTEGLSAAQVATIAKRYDHERSLIAAASTSERATFLDDKRNWLLDEIQLDELLALHEHLVKEIAYTRLEYVRIAGNEAADLVEAAHRLAWMRYRTAFPSLAPDELRTHLQQDLLAEGGAGAHLRLEPALRQALQETESGLSADRQLLAELQELKKAGRLQQASQDECKEAEREFRRLARLIYADYLEQHPQFANIDPKNQKRLKEIWELASATHRGRVQLSRERVLDFLANLRSWKEEVLRILAHLDFPTPSLLLHGETLPELHADLRRAMSDVRRQLHVVRDDIAAREFDPRHSEYRRVIAMNEEGRAAERQRMATLAEAWNVQARQLAAQLAAGASAAGATSETATQGPQGDRVMVPQPQRGEQQP